MADIPEYVKFTFKSKKDPSTNTFPIADYTKDLRNIVNNAVKSALPSDAFYHVGDKSISKQGKMSVDVYVHKDNAAAVDKASRYLVGKLDYVDDTGQSIGSKYTVTRAKGLTDDTARSLYKIETAPARKKEELENKKAKDASMRALHGAMLKVIAVLAGIADITRRILSSVISTATQAVQDNRLAHNLGLSYERVRNYRYLETAHNLKEGTITGAIADVQNKFGNITSLDEKSLEALAVVMGSQIEDMAKMGIGASNPETIVGAIVDAFNTKANAGYNSVGQYVGEQQARRELYSYLNKISPQIADIFATMQEEQHNINSLFRGQADTFASWKNLMPQSRGTTPAGNNLLTEAGQEWSIVKTILEQIRDAIAVTLSPTLLSLLRRIADTRIGMTQTEKEQRNRDNKKLNEAFIASAQATTKEMEADWDNLAPYQLARYYALKEAIRKAENANKGTGINKAINYAVPTQEELQVATQDIIKKQASVRALLGKDEAAHGYLDDITPQEIWETAEGNNYDIESRKKKFSKTYKKKENVVFRTMQAQKKMNQYRQNIDLKNVDSKANEDAKDNVTWQEWLKALMAAEAVYGVDFEHDARGNEVGLVEALNKAEKEGYLSFNGLSYSAHKPLDLPKEDLEEAFIQWMYYTDPQFFNEKILLKRAEQAILESEKDKYYDVNLLYQDYGANLEKLQGKLPATYSGTGNIISYDDIANGVVTHKIVFDLNNDGKIQASDVVLESFVTNRQGYSGTTVDRVQVANGKVITTASTVNSQQTSASKARP